MRIALLPVPAWPPLACCTLACAVSAFAAPVHAQDTLVGEWNVDAAACSRARVTYTADGRHQSLQHGDGGWTTQASGTYRRQGERVTVEFEGQAQTLEIVELTADRLVLRNPDPEQMQTLGVERVGFVRCPPRG